MSLVSQYFLYKTQTLLDDCCCCCCCCVIVVVVEVTILENLKVKEDSEIICDTNVLKMQSQPLLT